MWIVKLALSRPYTFVVLALVLLLISPVVLLRTPVDIFPSINIPVISVIWTYTGLAPSEMGTRIVSIFERSLTTSVNNIEHIESVAERCGGRQSVSPAVGEYRWRDFRSDCRSTGWAEAVPRRHHTSAGNQLQRLFGAHLAARLERARSL